MVTLNDINTLEEYLGKYGEALGRQAIESTEPRHRHDDELLPMRLKRTPLPAQAHVISASCKSLASGEVGNMIVSGECGTGKTFMGMAIPQVMADMQGKVGYRVIVACPPHLVRKWSREIKKTIPNVRVIAVDSYHDMMAMVKSKRKPDRAEFWVCSMNKMKMEPKWEAVYIKPKVRKGLACCACCHEPIMKPDPKTGLDVPVPEKDIQKKRMTCSTCKEPLWSWVKSFDRWPIARLLQRKFRNHFDFAVIDEVHKAKGDNTAVGRCFGKLVSSCKHTIALTGTLIGGYADNIRSMMFRLMPGELVADGLSWDNSNAFNHRYGKIETAYYENKSGEASMTNIMSSGGSESRKSERVRPGVMPSLFGRLLIGNTLFLSLEDVAEALPPLEEEAYPVTMDAELKEEYDRIESLLGGLIRSGSRSKAIKKLVGTWLRTMLGYPDYPYHWDTIGYNDADEDSGANKFVPVVTPESLGESMTRNKEKALLDVIAREKKQGRKCWVFCTMIEKHPTIQRLIKLTESHGYKVGYLSAKKVPTHKREQWIEENGPDCDVIFSHPGVVETGLDLFDSEGTYNFPTLIFYETGYSTYTMRQASRRSWRIGQKETCRVVYLYYRNSMQETAMALMAKKLKASEAIEGKFSTEGLVAMSEDTGSVEMALAATLDSAMDDAEEQIRDWVRVGGFDPESIKKATDKLPMLDWHDDPYDDFDYYGAEELCFTKF